MCKGNKKSVVSVKEQIRMINAARKACNEILGELDPSEPNGDGKFKYYREEDPANVKTCTINLKTWACSCKEFKKRGTFCMHLAHAYLMVTDWDGGDPSEVPEHAQARQTACPINDEVFSEDYKPGDDTAK